MSKKWIIVGFAIIVISLVSSAYILKMGKKSSSTSQESIRVSAGNGPHATVIQVAQENGYFRNEGLDVALVEHSTGKFALEALARDEFDLVTTAETPIMMAAVAGSDVRVVATIMNSDRDLVLIARRDSGIYSTDDLRGKQIGITKGTSSEFFCGTLLSLSGISYDEIIQVNLPPEDMLQAISTNQVDAVVVWNPFTTQIQEVLGDNATVFESKGIYTISYNVVGKEAYLQANPEEVQQFLRALIKATSFIQKNPRESQEIVVNRTGMDLELVQKIWPYYEFKTELNPALILNLENTTRWARDNQLIQVSEFPNYLDIIYFDGLDAVAPELVTIIH